MTFGSQKYEQPLICLLIGVFLISFSLIAFEILLSRLLSVLLSFHFVFIVLAVSLLGLGSGGIALYFLQHKRQIKQVPKNGFHLWASIYSLTLVLSVGTILSIPVLFQALDHIFFYSVLFLIPFLFAGVLLAHIFQSFPSESGKIYGIDLLGAAAGSFGSIILLNRFAVISSIFLLGTISAIGAVFLAWLKPSGLKKWIAPIMVLLITVLAFWADQSGLFRLKIPIGKNPDKEIHDVLYGQSISGKIVETVWSSFGRTDLVSLSGYPGQMDIYLDGTAGSPMYRFSGEADRPGSIVEALTRSFPGYFPFLSLQDEQKDSALIIGPGGGRDVLLALVAGFHEITAVEVNPDLVEMVKKHSAFNGGIYQDLKNVRIIIEEGRHFLKRNKDHYDIVMLSLPVTNSSRSLEGFALTENFLFTTDAIADYWNHLTEEGRLIIVTHDDREVLRLLSLCLAFFKNNDTSENLAMRHIYVVGSEDYPVLVLAKEPIDSTEATFLYQAMRYRGYNPSTTFFPGIIAPLNPVLLSLAHGENTATELCELAKQKGHNITPVTDDSPFFYNFEIGLPKSVASILSITSILLLAIAIIPFFKQNNRLFRVSGADWKRNRLQVILLFLSLGIGFMLIEISLIQRFTLFLGSPVFSMAVLLASLLTGAGFGSLISKRLIPRGQIAGGIARVCLWLALMILVYATLLPKVFDLLLGLSFPLRIGASILLLFPLGLYLGIPFPSGIRLLQEKGLKHLIPWVWGLNGLGSVFGSSLTVAIAICFGFTEALVTSAACYLALYFLFHNSCIEDHKPSG